MSESEQESRASWGTRIERLCDEFQRAYRGRQHPRISHYLDRIDAPARNRLVLELVSLEMELRREAGELPTVASYIEQFPEYAELLFSIEPGIFDSHVDHPSTETIAEPCRPFLPKFSFLGHFQLLAVLGQGAFGTVWKAFDTKLQREVALKIARQDRFGPGDLSLLLHEARAAANLRHPNIVRVYDIHEGDGERAPYIVSELVNGSTLKASLPLKDSSPRNAAELTAKIARALQHAHDHKITHRDLKPGNILLDADGEPHLADFGLAKWETAVDSFAKTGKLVGTPSYMAPEQARGLHDQVDARTDIYAVGVILYILLTGVPPFRGSTPQILEQIIDSPPPPLRSIRPAIPIELEKICLKCMAKDRDRRYQIAADLADDLDRFLSGESLHGIPIPIPRRIQKWAWRKRRVGALLASSVVFCMMVIAIAWWSTRPTEVRFPVRIETNPPGCEITAVPLDPSTGEPNPAEIEHAEGKTPLVMPLRPGDYLIVAVLSDSRFHEVLRHIPAKDETTPIYEPHQFWRRDGEGVITWRKIDIPPQDVTLPMGFVEGSPGWDVPTINKAHLHGSRIRIPSFYFDMAESLPEGTLTLFGRLNEVLEESGKRMPTAAELLYLQEVSMRPPSETGDQPLRLPEDTPISGLFELPWEWTISRATSGLPLVQGHQQMRTQVAGAPIVHYADREFGLTLRAQSEFATDAGTGIRGVRSVRPRRTPDDFPAILSD